MSDSDDTSTLPSDARITSALQKTVANIFNSGNLEDLTLKRVRNAVEQQLRLPEEFFKTSQEWKERSKTIVNAEVEACENKSQRSPSSPAVSAKKQKPTNAPKPVTKSVNQKPADKTVPRKDKKRPSPSTVPAPSKRRKIASASDSESEGDGGTKNISEELSMKPTKGVGTGTSGKPIEDKRTGSSAAVEEPDSNISVVLDDSPRKKQTKKKQSKRHSVSFVDSAIVRKILNSADDAISDSDLSSVIDEPAPKKKRQKKIVIAEVKKRDGKQKVKPAKGKEDLDPEEAEIKRLQSWLVKCGIRKLWHRELAPYDTSKAKISHLRNMLKDVGMDGRYSAEKARQIRERRELEADLEAVQEGARRWGHSASEDDAEEEGGRPKRRLARGFKNLAFLGDEGEETD